MRKRIAPDQRRALRLLDSSDGMTERLLAAHGIPTETVAELLRAGLATAHVERLGRALIKRTVLTITDKGREVIG